MNQIYLPFHPSTFRLHPSGPSCRRRRVTEISHVVARFVTYTSFMGEPSLLLDDAGASIVVAAAHADELLRLFSAHGIKCRRCSAANGEEIRFPDANDVLLVDSLLQGWLHDTGVTGSADARHSHNGRRDVA